VPRASGTRASNIDGAAQYAGDKMAAKPNTSGWRTSAWCAISPPSEEPTMALCSRPGRVRKRMSIHRLTTCATKSM
jgi:hypothetical protein